MKNNIPQVHLNEIFIFSNVLSISPMALCTMLFISHMMADILSAF